MSAETYTFFGPWWLSLFAYGVIITAIACHALMIFGFTDEDRT